MPMIVQRPPKRKPIPTGAHWLWLLRMHTGWTRRLSRPRWIECLHRHSDAACPRPTPNRYSFPATWPDSASINRLLDFVRTSAASARPKESYSKDTETPTVSFMTQVSGIRTLGQVLQARNRMQSISRKRQKKKWMRNCRTASGTRHSIC